MIQTVTLGEIASIQSGITLRERPQASPHSSMRLMQLGDLDILGQISFDTMLPVEPHTTLSRYVAEPGDLVFRGRGAGISVAVMPLHEGEIAVVLPLILIRPNRESVDPDYLGWAINSPSAQRHFALHIRGTGTVGVGKRDLETLAIDMPDIVVQRKIATLISLQKSEAELINRYQRVRRQLLDHLLLNMVTSGAANPHTKGSKI